MEIAGLEKNEIVTLIVLILVIVVFITGVIKPLVLKKVACYILQGIFVVFPRGGAASTILTGEGICSSLMV